jgi:hypothetical protein
MSNNSSEFSLLNATKMASFVGVPLTLFTTLGIYLATDDMKIQTDFAWKFGLWYALFCFAGSWLIYFRYRKSELFMPRMINGLIGASGGFALLGFMPYFFYFGFAPMPMWAHILGVGGGLGLSIYWGYLVWGDVMTALHKGDLLSRIYVEKEDAIYYMYHSIKNKKPLSDRTPFKSFHIYAAMLVAPFAVVLNRVLTPYAGSGHGVFMVLSFFGLPMILTMVGFAVQFYILGIYYPIKLKRQTGKSVVVPDEDF